MFSMWVLGVASVTSLTRYAATSGRSPPGGDPGTQVEAGGLQEQQGPSATSCKSGRLVAHWHLLTVVTAVSPSSSAKTVPSLGQIASAWLEHCSHGLTLPSFPDCPLSFTRSPVCLPAALNPAGIS